MVAAIDSITPHLTLQDRIRLYLDEKISETGSNYISITISDLARELHQDRQPVYQALYRIKSNKEIELDQDDDPDNRNMIRGIIVKKLAPSNRTYRRAAERGKASVAATQVNSLGVGNINDGMPNLSAYLKQRLTVENMKEAAEKSGLDPDSVVQFEHNPIAEEGLILLQKVVELSTALEESRAKIKKQEFDLDAANRDIEYLKRKTTETTRRELVAVN